MVAVLEKLQVSPHGRTDVRKLVLAIVKDQTFYLLRGKEAEGIVSDFGVCRTQLHNGAIIGVDQFGAASSLFDGQACESSEPLC